MDPNAVPTSLSTPQTQPVIPQKSNKNNLGLILGVIILILFSILGGFFLGQTSAKKQAPIQVQTSKPSETLKTDPFFDLQIATILGEVVNNSATMITIKNSKGQVKDFPISPKLIINKIDSANKPATSSSDLSSLEIGKRLILG